METINDGAKGQNWMLLGVWFQSPDTSTADISICSHSASGISDPPE